jgi:hypothetical protein
MFTKRIISQLHKWIPYRLSAFKFSFSSSTPPQEPPFTTSDPPQEPPFSKELYLKELTSDREALEQERTECLDAVAQYSKRKAKEIEVLTASIDFAKVSVENLTLFPSEFRHPDELRYYVGSVKHRLTEENLLKCLNGYIKFAPILAQGLFELENPDTTKERIPKSSINENIPFYNMNKSNDPQKIEGNNDNSEHLGSNLSTPLSASDLSSFSNFIMLIQSHLPSASMKFTLAAAFFADIYCLQKKDGFWEILERKVLFFREKLKIEDFLLIFGCFTRQREGSEYFYERSEEIIENKWGSLDTPTLIGILKSFYLVRYGTTRFVVRLLEKLEEGLAEIGKTSLIDFLEVYVHSSYMKEKVIEMLEEKFKKMEGLSIGEIGRIATAFGSYRGSNALFAVLEDRARAAMGKDLRIEIKNDTPTISLEELKIILSGFLFSSRGSKDFFETIKPILLHYIEQLTPIEYSKLFKFLSTNGYLKEKPMQIYLEKKIVARLKEIKEINAEEIAEIVKNVCISRHGSRELYKLMELVVGHKIDEICNHPKAGSQIYRYYETSGLCSSELLGMLERKLVE